MKYFLIAGEASGDLHASHLITALKAQDAEAEIRFIGGDEMALAAGCAPLRHYSTLAYMGFIQVVLHLRTILQGMTQCKKYIQEWHPDCVILVDYPGFNLGIAEFVHRQGICPVYYYISPKIWAWKEGRIHRIRRDVDHLFSILPFEVDFFEGKHHYPITYVGNPTVDEIAQAGIHYTPQRTIALLPGSRTAEIQSNLPAMLEAALPYADKGYRIVVSRAPSQPQSLYDSIVRGRAEMFSGKSFDLLQQAEVALVTSGTATLETALIGVPQVVCYYMRMGAIVKRLRPLLLKVPFISLPNLVCQREIIPELVGSDMNASNLGQHLAGLVEGGERRAQQLQDYHDLRQRMGEPGAPQRCAAGIIERLKSQKK